MHVKKNICCLRPGGGPLGAWFRPYTGLTTSTKTWLHVFVPINCTASIVEIKAGITATLAKTNCRIKPGDNDFKLIDPSKGKYHVNFEVDQATRNYVPESLAALGKMIISGAHCKVYLSPDFLRADAFFATYVFFGAGRSAQTLGAFFRLRADVC